MPNKIYYKNIVYRLWDNSNNNKYSTRNFTYTNAAFKCGLVLYIYINFKDLTFYAYPRKDE